MDWITLGEWVAVATCIRVMYEVILRNTDYWDKEENLEHEMNYFQNGNS